MFVIIDGNENSVETAIELAAVPNAVSFAVGFEEAPPIYSFVCDKTGTIIQ